MKNLFSDSNAYLSIGVILFTGLWSRLVTIKTQFSRNLQEAWPSLEPYSIDKNQKFISKNFIEIAIQPKWIFNSGFLVIIVHVYSFYINGWYALILIFTSSLFSYFLKFVRKLTQIITLLYIKELELKSRSQKYTAAELKYLEKLHSLSLVSENWP